MLNEMSDNETVNPVFLKVTEWTAENNPSSSWGAARLDDDNGISQTDSDTDFFICDILRPHLWPVCKMRNEMDLRNNRKSDDIFKMLIVGLLPYGAFLTPGDHQNR